MYAKNIQVTSSDMKVDGVTMQSDIHNEVRTSPHEGEHQSSIQVCRGCLSVDGLTPANPSLSHAFTQATGVEWHNERLADVLCVQCKALTIKCKTFRRTAQRVNDVLIQFKLNLSNIKKIKRKQRLEPRHYPPNHCDLYHDADHLQDEKKFKMEENVSPKETKHIIIPIEYIYPQVDVKKGFGNQWKAPKTEFVDPMGQTPMGEVDSHHDDVDLGMRGIDEADIKLQSSAMAFEIPDFRGLSSSTNTCHYNATPTSSFSAEASPLKKKLVTKGSTKSAASTSTATETSAVKNNSATNVFTCRKCKLRFSSNEILTEHSKRCTVFNAIRRPRKSLKAHTVEDECYTCNVCDTKFSRSGNLIQHMRVHTGEKPYACYICGKKYCQASSLNYHLNIHKRGMTYACKLCDYKSIHKRLLNIHYKTHTVKEKPFACHVCDQKYTADSTLKRHLMTHTGEKPYVCDICGHKTTQQSHLKTHLRTHTGEKPYACNICDSKFSQSSILTQHLRVHTGEKPYICDYCGYKCAQRTYLRQHIKSHTGEKPYACEYCDFKSSHNAGLKVHLRNHTGEKPYMCNLCDFKCSRSTSLKRHKKSCSSKILIKSA